jgi:ketosteroid isomerase-like protein
MDEASMNAAAFAAEWIAAWNAHDLSRILSHYAEDVVLVSPRVRDILGEPSGTVRGKPALSQYFAQGMARLPDLKFTLLAVYAGVESVVVNFRANYGHDVSELMVFDSDGLVREVRAHWME